MVATVETGHGWVGGWAGFQGLEVAYDLPVVWWPEVTVLPVHPLSTPPQSIAALQVNLKLFQPAPNRRRTVLLFVFRDRTKTPLEKLIETWEGDLLRMWEGITKPQQYECSSFNDFFDVQYAALR